MIIESLLIALSVLGIERLEAQDSDFSYYLGELQEQKLKDDDPMRRLIIRRLAEAVFDTAQSTAISQRLYEIQKLSSKRPDLYSAMAQLDANLQSVLQSKIKIAKEKRLIYSASGAAVGALIAIPLVKLPISKLLRTEGPVSLWIAVPSSALMGGAAGFLLGDLLEISSFRQADQVVKSELHYRSLEQPIEQEISK